MELICTRSRKLTVIMALVCIGLMSIYPFVGRSFAQDDEPTDVPFPTSAATATTETSVATVEATAEVTAETTAVLTVNDAVATAGAAQATADDALAQNKTLQDELAAAQADRGATIFAVAIIVIGVLLALAVFFGLKRTAH